MGSFVAGRNMQHQLSISEGKRKNNCSAAPFKSGLSLANKSCRNNEISGVKNADVISTTPCLNQHQLRVSCFRSVQKSGNAEYASLHMQLFLFRARKNLKAVQPPIVYPAAEIIYQIVTILFFRREIRVSLSDVRGDHQSCDKR